MLALIFNQTAGTQAVTIEQQRGGDGDEQRRRDKDYVPPIAEWHFFNDDRPKPPEPDVEPEVPLLPAMQLLDAPQPQQQQPPSKEFVELARMMNANASDEEALLIWMTFTGGRQ